MKQTNYEHAHVLFIVITNYALWTDTCCFTCCLNELFTMNMHSQNEWMNQSHWWLYILQCSLFSSPPPLRILWLHLRSIYHYNLVRRLCFFNFEGLQPCHVKQKEENKLLKFSQYFGFGLRLQSWIFMTTAHMYIHTLQNLFLLSFPMYPLIMSWYIIFT